MQLREVRLVGSGKTPASVKFTEAANVISGNSDTGKSYILRCVDFVLGAEELKKRIDEAEGYEFVQLEFVNEKGDFLTLVRNVKGGDVQVHRTPIDAIQGDGETVAWKRQGQSAGADVTAIFLPFANMPEAKLFSGGSKQPVRLTVRTLMPAFLVDEGSIIAERSPVYGDTGFDNPARKRMLSFLLTGHDDAGIIVEKKREIVRAETNAKIALIDDMLKELRADAAAPNPSDSPNKEEQPISTIDRADAAIQRLSSSLAEDREERARLQMERSDALKATQGAEAQIIAINELLTRYDLLAKRYDSDLERLDFVSEGSYYLNQLQDARCPLCDQVMDESHREHVSGASQIGRVYSSAKAEAGKINGLKADLTSTVEDLARRRESRQREFAKAAARMEEIDTDLSAADETDRERLTLEAMARDDSLIYGGQIRADELLGMPDLLRKELGGYVPGDIKSGRGKEGGSDENDGKPKLHYAVQLALYVDILERLKLSAGRRGFVWDIQGAEVAYDFTTLPGEMLWDEYQSALAHVQAILTRQLTPLAAYGSVCKLCHWHTFCIADLTAADDLTLIPQLGRKERDVMHETIPTVAALAESNPDGFLKGKKTLFAGIGPERLRLFQARAAMLKGSPPKPYLRAPVLLNVFPFELFFDIEVDPLRDICYLHGFVERHNGDNATERFVPFFAEEVTPVAERDTFAAALDYLAAHPDGAIYFLLQIRAYDLPKAAAKIPEHLHSGRH